MAGYMWPGPFKPFRHQIATSVFAAAHLRAFILNDIGTGKTASAIWAFDWMLAQSQIKRILVIAPKSTIDAVWVREILKLTPRTKTAALVGSAAKRRQLLADERNTVCIINPDALHLLIEWTSGGGGTPVPRRSVPGMDTIDLIVVDESTKFKTARTRRYRALRYLCDGKRLWAMSGAPMPQAPTDIWATAKLICPERVPRTFGRFRDDTMYKTSNHPFAPWHPRPGVEKYVAELIRDYSIRFSRDQCLDLPPSQSISLRAPETAEQRKLRLELEKEAAAELADGMIVSVNEGVHVAKLLQLACGAVRYRNDKNRDTVHYVDCQPKLDALDDVLEGAEGPVIVYSPYLAAMDLLERHFAKTKITYRRVDGSTSSPQRLAAFDCVQQNAIKVLLAQPSAVQYGITLTRSNTVLWWGLPFSQDTYQQAKGRIQREGQARKQYIVHLVSSPVESAVYRRLLNQEALQGTLLEIIENRVAL